MRQTPSGGIMGCRRPLGAKRELARRRTSMSAEENMALARRFMRARIKGDLEAVDEIMTPDFVSRTPLLSVQEPDREDAIRAIAQLSRAISNPSIHFEDQVAAADKVVSRFVVHATHDRGELMGVAPTGRELTWMGIFIHLLSEGRLGLVVGDATGKGVPAALVMSTTCGMLQLAAQALGSSSSPGKVLAQVNEALLARIPANMFVTCFYAILDPRSGSLTYANAGHDLPYVHSNG